MIESYAVGGVFKIIDEASRPLGQISDRLSAMDRLIKQVQSTFDKIGTLNVSAALTGIGDIQSKLLGMDQTVANSIGKIAGIGSEFSSVGNKASAAVSAIRESLTGADTALGNTTAAAGRLGERIRQIGSDARDLGGIPRLLGGSGGGRGGSPAHPRPGHSGGHAAEVGMNLGMIGTLGFGEVSGGIKDVFKRAFELQHVQEQMAQANISSDDIARATSSAVSVGSKYGIGIPKVLSDIKELAFPLGSVGHAIDFVDPLERMRLVLNSVSEGRGTQSADSVYAMARAGELKGLQTPQEFQSYFDQMTKVISATGGKVTPEGFVQAMKYGRVASLGWDEEFTTRQLPSLMQSLGPSGAGTAAMSLFGTLAEGHVSKKTLGQMEDLGLITDYGKVQYDKQGNPVGFNPGAIANTDEFVKNPAIWAQQTLLPMLTSKFGDLAQDTNRLHAAEALGGLFGNRMSAQSISEFILRMQSINKDSGLIDKANGLGGADRLMAQDPTAAVTRFSSAWDNLLLSLGKSSVQTAVDQMNNVSSGFASLTRWATENPGATKSFLIAGTAIAGTLGILTGVGVINMMALFLPGGAWAVGAAALVSTLATVAAFNWTALKSALGIAPLPAAGSSVPDLSQETWSDWWHWRAPGSDGLGGAIGHPTSVPSFPLTRGQARDFFGDGSGLPLGFQLNAYGSNDNGNSITTIGQGVLLGLQMYAGGGPSAGGAGGGIVNAAYTTYGAASGVRTGGLGGAFANLSAAGMAGEHADYIRKRAAALGIDPRYALAVAHSEGLGAKYAGDYGTSFGDFQLHYGGSGIRGMNSGGLGDLFTKKTGLDARDPRTWKEQADFALQQVRKGGWSPWHGAAHVGIHGFDGVGRMPPVVTAPPRKVTPGAPPGDHGSIEAAIHRALDGAHMPVTLAFDERAGAHLAKIVTRKQAESLRHPRGTMNNHGHYVSPGTPVTDAA